LNKEIENIEKHLDLVGRMIEKSNNQDDSQGDRPPNDGSHRHHPQLDGDDARPNLPIRGRHAHSGSNGGGDDTQSEDGRDDATDRHSGGDEGNEAPPVRQRRSAIRRRR